jgi:uncharacterized protein YndB with AHSA1/START domain
MNVPTTDTSPELVITRTLRAPRELVWKAWSDPKHLVQWMGPREHPASHVEGDFRPGGKWRSRLTSKDGSGNLWLGGVYREIVEPERVVYTFAWDGDDGKPENEMLITLTFAEEGANKTKMTLRQTLFRSDEQRDGHRGGWNSAFDRLEEFLASQSAKS